MTIMLGPAELTEHPSWWRRPITLVGAGALLVGVVIGGAEKSLPASSTRSLASSSRLPAAAPTVTVTVQAAPAGEGHVDGGQVDAAQARVTVVRTVVRTVYAPPPSDHGIAVGHPSTPASTKAAHPTHPAQPTHPGQPSHPSSNPTKASRPAKPSPSKPSQAKPSPSKPSPNKPSPTKPTPPSRTGTSAQLALAA